jgi:hypothetical protein
VRSIAALQKEYCCVAKSSAGLDLEDPGLFVNDEDLPEPVLRVWLPQPMFLVWHALQKSWEIQTATWLFDQYRHQQFTLSGVLFCSLFLGKNNNREPKSLQREHLSLFFCIYV